MNEFSKAYVDAAVDYVGQRYGIKDRAAALRKAAELLSDQPPAPNPERIRGLMALTPLGVESLKSQSQVPARLLASSCTAPTTIGAGKSEPAPSSISQRERDLYNATPLGRSVLASLSPVPSPEKSIPTRQSDQLNARLRELLSLTPLGLSTLAQIEGEQQ